MNEMIRDDHLLETKGQTLLAAVKARIAELEFPDPKNWSPADRPIYAMTVSRLVEYLENYDLSKQVQLEKVAEALLLMVKSGFWWEYDDPGRV